MLLLGKQMCWIRPLYKREATQKYLSGGDTKRLVFEPIAKVSTHLYQFSQPKQHNQNSMLSAAKPCRGKKKKKYLRGDLGSLKDLTNCRHQEKKLRYNLLNKVNIRSLCFVSDYSCKLKFFLKKTVLVNKQYLRCTRGEIKTKQ